MEIKTCGCKECNCDTLIGYISPRGSLTGTLSSGVVPADYLVATDEDIDALFKEEEKDG